MLPVTATISDISATVQCRYHSHRSSSGTHAANERFNANHIYFAVVQLVKPLKNVLIRANGGYGVEYAITTGN